MIHLHTEEQWCFSLTRWINGVNLLYFLYPSYVGRNFGFMVDATFQGHNTMKITSFTVVVVLG